MRAGKRNIKSGLKYDHLFPNVKGEFVTIKRYAHLADTIDLMQNVINDTLEDTHEISALLKADNIKQTCRNIWNFSFKHLQYTRDEKGKEQVRRPARSWRDRTQGVDCDCMTVFIASILVNLGIPYTIRLTKEKSVEFEHVYPVVKTQSETIILDAVVHQFNTEAPYREKKDIDMRLEYLNGIDSQEEDDAIIDDLFNDYPIDAQQLVVDGELEGLDGRFRDRFKKWKSKRKANKAERKKLPLKDRIKKGFKKALNVVNKLNPGAALLRLGLLASMKLNIGKVARKIRFAYWDRATALRNNMLPNKYNDLQRVRKKLESIFYGAGGKIENLKKAILKGKGNKDKKVQLNGLGSVIDDVDDNDSLQDILGDEMYFEETADQGVEGLGVVATAATGAAVTAAAGIVATIVSLLKKVGGVFKKGSAQEKIARFQDNSDNAQEKTRKFSLQKIMNSPFVKRIRDRRSGGVNRSQQRIDNSEQQAFNDFVPTQKQAPLDTSNEESTDSIPDDFSDEKDNKEEKGFGAWVKKNKVAVGIGSAVIAGGIFLGVRAMMKKKKAVNGVSRTTKKRTKRKPTARKTSLRKSTKRKTTSRKTGGSSRRMVELG